jgi:16S rRNA (cytosine1402-N4)-methyltransferase
MLHNPVMLEQVLSALKPQDGEIYVDGTFGAGGYSKAILQAANCQLHAIDRDPNVAPFAEKLQQEYEGRFHFHAGRFADMAKLIAKPVDGIVLDIGVSSMQLDEAERGFSFRHNAPLDMRMSANGVSAADLVNNLEQTELAKILWEYGEERESRKIATAIINARATEKITTTFALRDIIYSVIRPRGDKIDPATRSFQALRIAVNDELQQLQQALQASLSMLKAGGRLVVVAFHSLEDRIVKQFFHKMNGAEENISRHNPSILSAPNPQYFTLPKQKAIRPTEAEIAANPRSRSSILRYGIRTSTIFEGA